MYLKRDTGMVEFNSTCISHSVPSLVVILLVHVFNIVFKWFWRRHEGDKSKKQYEASSRGVGRTFFLVQSSIRAILYLAAWVNMGIGFDSAQTRYDAWDTRERHTKVWLVFTITPIMGLCANVAHHYLVSVRDIRDVGSFQWFVPYMFFILYLDGFRSISQLVYHGRSMFGDVLTIIGTAMSPVSLLLITLVQDIQHFTSGPKFATAFLTIPLILGYVFILLSNCEQTSE